jgi:hypothetical protein
MRNNHHNGHNFNTELQEFFLSFNTTICIGMAIFIFLIMKNHSFIIKDETMDAIADYSIKFIPDKVINLIQKDAENEELLPV